MTRKRRSQFRLSLLLFVPSLGLLFLAETLTQEENKAAHFAKVGATEAANYGRAELKNPSSEEFVIGPGDVLNIFVWKEPEVSRTVPVRPDGKLSLPLVNDVQAAGLTPMNLKSIITEKLAAFISDPTVTVTVEAVNSQKVVVVGEVNKSGPQPLTGPMRIMDILSNAGFTPFAKTTKIYVLRSDSGKQEKFDFNYKEYVKGKGLDQNILLKSGDTIIVP